jgi:hypothetical protein
VRILGQVESALARSEGLLVEVQRQRAAGRGPVLVWSIVGGLLPNVLEGLLGHALQLRGVPAEVFVCDKVLPACEGRTIRLYPGHQVSPAADQRLCDKCFFLSHRAFEALRLPYTRLGDLLDSAMVEHAEHLVGDLSPEQVLDLSYRDYHLGPIIRSSIIRFFLRVDLPDSPLAEAMLRRYGVAAILLTDILERLVDERRPSAMLTSHGVYITWGIITEVAKRRNIPVTVWAPAYRQSELLLSQGTTYFEELAAEPTSAWEAEPLTPDQSARLQEYMDSRWSRAGQDRLTLYSASDQRSEPLWQQLGLDPAKPTLALFPNIGWDSQVYYRNVAFPNMYEWIAATLSFFVQHPEVQLVVRTHPVEAWFPRGIAQNVVDEMQRRFPILPENVRVVPAADPLNSYALAKIIRAAVVHGTQLGLELAYRGLPVIVTGGVHYRGKGFTYDVGTAAEYLALLEGFPELPPLTSEQVEWARRYCYHAYFKRQIPFPYVEYSGKANIGNLHLDSLADLLPGKDETLDLIARNIIEGKPFVVNA